MTQKKKGTPSKGAHKAQDLFPETQQSGLAAREVALDILTQILQQTQSLDLVLDRHEKLYELEARDRGFARLLVATVLRRLGQLDFWINNQLERPDSMQIIGVRNIMRMALAQLVFLQTPPHAAINTAVELAEKSQTLKHYKSLINAVLRRLNDKRPNPDENIHLNTPVWMWNEWGKDYGEDITYEIALANLTEAALDLTVKNDPDEWALKLNGTILPGGSIRLEHTGRIQEIEGYETGEWWIQDIAASLPAKLLGHIEHKTVVDLCAAPGGKTAQLASKGAHVIALDRAAKRIHILQQNMARLNFDVETVVADGAVWQPKEKVDAVLLDAPCSATGTIRRHPDILSLKTQRDVDRLVELQSRLLDNAAGMVKDGGVLVYCTCSLQKREGEYQADAFLNRHPEFVLSPIEKQEIDNAQNFITSQGYVRTFPFYLQETQEMGSQKMGGQEMGGMDGFFIARFIKKA